MFIAMKKPEPQYKFARVVPDAIRIVNSLEPGVYLSVDLHTMYWETLMAEGRTPVSHVAFGQALGQIGMIRRSGVDSIGRRVAAWRIHHHPGINS